MCQTKKSCPKDPDTGVQCGGKSHGTCDATTQACLCAPGWTGERCEKIDKLCSGSNCNNHGSCVKGVCFCDTGFTGKFCEKPATCLADTKVGTEPCGGRGLCYENVCRCYPGFVGEFCEIAQHAQTCKNNCTGHGVCEFGQCICQPSFIGDDCSQHEPSSFCATTAGDCSGHGVCYDGKCQCEPGTSGTFCEIGGCKKCHQTQGVCLKEKCYCKPGFGGDDCAQVLTCPSGCSNHGTCVNGLCHCDKFYTGVACEVPELPPGECPNHCSGNGVCHQGKCMCAPGKTGVDCATSLPTLKCGAREPKPIALTASKSALKPSRGHVGGDEGEEECNGNGACFRNLCVCKPGYHGKYCEKKKTCSAECARNGVCNYGACLCAPEFTGKDCQISTRTQSEIFNVLGKSLDTFKASGAFTCKDGDAYKCSLHGVCSSNKCICDEGFSGVACEQVLLTGIYSARCPHGCNDHGFCQFGKCVCDLGWHGKSCEQKFDMPCEKDCNGKGICEFGRCHCDSDYAGPTCEIKLKCAVDCASRDQGVCVAGRCVCLNGYTGIDCSHPPKSSQDGLNRLGVQTVRFTGARSGQQEAQKQQLQQQQQQQLASGLVDPHIHAELSSTTQVAAAGQYVVPVHPAIMGVAAFFIGVLVAFAITYAYYKREEQQRKKPLFATR